MARVLFVCVHNAGRSQMSQALFELATGRKHESDCAGTTPAECVHPEVVEVMRELGVELADRRPKNLTNKLVQWADVIVTMGCGDRCPYIPDTLHIDWELTDPEGQPLAAVRRTRDEIDRRVRELIDELE